jgi:hypothetical protein
MKKLFMLSVMSAALGLSACGGGSSSSISSGTLNVAMTDNPACGFDHVYVTVKQVRVNANANAGDNDAGWQTVSLATPSKVDLLSLTNGVLSQLGQTPLPSGHYQQIRLVLAENTSSTPLANSIVATGGTEQALTTPSATQSGYKVVGEFTVLPDTLTDLVLDFDACHSVVQRGNGSFSLKPVVTATPVVVSGSISGYVSTSEVGATVYAEQNGRVIKGTTVNTDGSFRLSPLTQSLTNGSYDVVVVDNGFSNAVIRSVPVVATVNTTVSTAAAPITAPTSITRTLIGNAIPAADGIVIHGIQTSNGVNYEVKSTNANIDTGAYSLTLSGGAPYIGTYTGTLPVTLSADSSVTGQYTIRADNTTKATTQSTAITSSTSGSINFSF